jgi:hypothetical protein
MKAYKKRLKPYKKKMRMVEIIRKKKIRVVLSQHQKFKIMIRKKRMKILKQI